MGLQFYKPTKSNSGGACTFSFNSKEECAFIELIKQNGWDASGRGGQGNGIFKGGARVNIKLSAIECGAFIRALEHDLPSIPALVHSGENGTKTVRFYQWGKDDKGVGEFKGWALSALAKDKENKETKVSCSLSFNEVVVIREYFKFALVHIFSALYAEDKKRAKEYAERKEGGGMKVTETKFEAEKPKAIEEFVKPDSSQEEDDGSF